MSGIECQMNGIVSLYIFGNTNIERAIKAFQDKKCYFLVNKMSDI